MDDKLKKDDVCLYSRITSNRGDLVGLYYPVEYNL